MDQSAILEFLIDSIQNELNLGRTIESARASLRRAFDPSLVDQAVTEFYQRLRHAQESDSAVVRDLQANREDWYGGPSRSPDSHWGLLKEHLMNEKDWSEPMVESLDRASTTVLANLAPPFGESRRCVKGLVLGYVQSGKTANFSAVIAKAVDSGYRMVVVLAGIHNNLRLQTERRLFNEICAPKLSACTNLTAVDQNGDFKRTQTQKAERACGRSDGFALAVIKKNSRVLRNFDSWLAEATPEVLRSCPTLIIDDESDHASVNYNNPEESPTAINQLIRNIIVRFGSVSYVGYTATPFANILIDSSIEDDLYPRDFLVSLEKPPTYFGAEELFGSEALTEGGSGKAGIPVIRSVDLREASILTAAKRRNNVPPRIGEELPENLRQAVTHFILAGAIRLTRGHWKDHITMLVHTSRLTDYQAIIFEKIGHYIEFMKAQTANGLDNSEEVAFEQLYESDYLPVTKLFPAAPKWTFDQVKQNIPKFIQRIEVIIDNSNSDERLSFDRTSPLCGIIIGGDTLSRGLTIEGLTTSYYVRDAKGYDTLMQMGRWFGYRPGYVDLTRVFMTEGLQKKFFHLSTVEEEMRSEIKVMAENRERPIDVALRIRSHPSMAVTSNLKMRHAQETAFTFSGTKLQARYITVNDSKREADNFRSVIELLDGMEKYGVAPSKSGFEDFSACTLYRKVPVELILQFLDVHPISEGNVKFSSVLLKNYITDLIQQDELKSWSVALMSSKSGDVLDLGKGRKVFKVQRSVLSGSLSERDPKGVYLVALSPPEDELVDLDDLASATCRSVSEFRKRADGTKSNCSAMRVSLRPTNRGLLLLYPLDTSGSKEVTANQGETEGVPLGRLTPLSAGGEIFGVTIVFPKTTKANGPHHYVVNGTL